ncbi:MAG TPA: hypothetical protein VEA37_08625, partial [Flavobacterium sp.]|nr:hypothetical protein [Flavobacterium sp.]
MLIHQKLNISKKHFLQNSHDGFDFYEHILGELKLADSCRCENIRNPFYGDKNPSFSIYYDKGKEIWRYHDYGDPMFSGDVFNFAATYYSTITDKFWQVLEKMYDDLGIEKPAQEIEM